MKMICFAIPKFLFMQFRGLHYQAFIPLGEISKTQHMWSFFGRSYNYNLFIGVVEFLIGILIVFKRTRLIALLLSVGVCSNILVLNIEFDADFAVHHAFLDFVISIFLLSTYRKDLYMFFIEFGGKLKSRVTSTSNSLVRKLLYTYIIVFPVGYFIFAYNLRSSVDEELVGSYQIKTFEVDGHPLTAEKGKLGSLPLICFEYNSMVVLSINDSTYYGRYSSEAGTITMEFRATIAQKVKTFKGKLANGIFEGRINDGALMNMAVEKLSPKKDYLNDLYIH